MFRRASALLILLPVVLTSCRKDASTVPVAPPRIRAAVSVLPQADFVSRIGGANVAVEVLVGPGQDPHTFEPTPQQMAALSEATVYFRIGMPFEDTLLEKVASLNKGLRIVNTAEGIELLPSLEEEEQDQEGHRPAGETHSGEAHHGDKDPHIWLDPKLVKTQAETICRALSELDAANSPTYRENLLAFQRELDQLDARLAKSLAPLKGRAFFVYHPAFGYFAAAYGLKQVAVETGGKEPPPRQVAALVERARREGVKVIFVQPQFSDKTARAIAREIGGAVVAADDLPRDYLAGMDKLAGAVEEALGKPAP